MSLFMGACGRRPTLVRCWGAPPCPADHRAGRHADHADRLWHQRPAAADIWVDRYCGGRFCGAEHDAERRVGAADRECEGERGCTAAAPSPCLLTSGARGGGSRPRHWCAGRAPTGSCPFLAPPALLARWQTAQTVQAALAAQTALAALSPALLCCPRCALRCWPRCAVLHASLHRGRPRAAEEPERVNHRYGWGRGGRMPLLGRAQAGRGGGQGASAAGRGLAHLASLGAEGPAEAVQPRWLAGSADAPLREGKHGAARGQGRQPPSCQAASAPPPTQEWWSTLRPCALCCALTTSCPSTSPTRYDHTEPAVSNEHPSSIRAAASRSVDWLLRRFLCTRVSRPLLIGGRPPCANTPAAHAPPPPAAFVHAAWTRLTPAGGPSPSSPLRTGNPKARNPFEAARAPQDVMNLIVVNESKLRRNAVAPKLPLIEATVGAITAASETRTAQSGRLPCGGPSPRLPARLGRWCSLLGGAPAAQSATPCRPRCTTACLCCLAGRLTLALRSRCGTATSTRYRRWSGP